MRKFLMAGFIVLSGNNLANATQIITNYSIYPQPAGLWQVFVPYIDTSLYTLNSVEISVSAALNGMGSAQNYDYVGGNATIFSAASVSIFNPNYESLQTTNLNAAPYTQYLNQYDGSIFSDSTSYTVYDLLDYQSSYTVVTDAYNLGYFSTIGLGYVILNTQDLSYTTSDMTILSQLSASISADLTIIENYSPIVVASTPPTSVPEPATLGLFGLGAAGLAMLRRRRAAA